MRYPESIEALFMQKPFSYTEYQALLDDIKITGKLCDYPDALYKDSFIILRHDVEFSPLRAYELAKFENQNGITSTYFFQLTNNAYNFLSGVNLQMAREILNMGHKIGLHFHLHGMKDRNQIEKKIIEECSILSNALGVNVDRFSFHRPPDYVLEKPIIIKGLINAYDPAYFTFSKETELLNYADSIKYIADSQNRWNYADPWGKPCLELFRTYPRIQILCHPYSWSITGNDTLANLRELIEENRSEFIQTLCDETKYVRDYLDEL